VEEGTQFFLRQNYRKGLESLGKAFAADPQNVEIGIFLGKIYYELRDYRKAERFMGQVLKEKPRHFEANLLNGLLSKRQGKLVNAKKYLTNALAIAPASVAARLFLGSVAVALGEETEAVKYFSQAVDIRPSSQLHLWLGSIYSRQGRVQQAIRHMKKAIEIDPRCGEAFYQMGLAFLEKNNKSRAKECFQNALRLNPKELRYKDALNFSFGESPVIESSVQMRKFPAINDEKMESLVKDELQLNFLPKRIRIKTGKETSSRK
jgi:tetratricopeptide (TPR) repeat protein